MLNLVIRFKDGSVDAMEWRNACIEEKCDYANCIETTHFVQPAVSTTSGDTSGLEKQSEKNCYVRSCVSSAETSNCDTKIFVTFIGQDGRDRFMLSDNFRITNFLKHSIQSYFDSAISAGDRSSVAEAIVSQESAVLT